MDGRDEDPSAGGLGFDYHLSEEQLAAYRDKPLELRLAWLYQGNVLRMHYPPEIIARQDRFRRVGPVPSRFLGSEGRPPLRRPVGPVQGKDE